MKKSNHSLNNPVFETYRREEPESGQEVIKMTCKTFEHFRIDGVMEMIDFREGAQNKEINRISALVPDVISLQSVPVNAEELISIPGYESIFFASQYSDFGVVTLWNPEKLNMVKCFKLDFYLKNQRHSNASGLIVILHTRGRRRICVANCNLEGNDKKSKAQQYFLLRKLNWFRGEADQLVIFGVPKESFKVLCVDGDFSGFEESVVEELKKVVGKEKENTLRLYLGNGEKSNEMFRFNLLRVEKTDSQWVYYLGRLSLRCENEVFYIESRT